MSYKLLAALAGLALLGSVHAAESALENPQLGAIESGISVISGWYCPAAAITVQIDNNAPFAVPYGSQRADAASRCDGVVNTGFSYLFNYNTLATGAHVIKALADGVQFASVNINVVTLGAEFLTGKAGEYTLFNFPEFGKRTRVAWQQSKQNFVILGTDSDMAPINGTYVGGIVTTNSGCATAGNNGSNRFDLNAFTLTFGAQSLLSIITENSNAKCDFTGTAFYTTNGGNLVVPAGSFACTNSLKGTWSSDRIVIDPAGILANMTIKYTAGETCTAVGHIGAAR